MNDGLHAKLSPVAKLVGVGRAAEVFWQGPDKVIRRYRDGRDCAVELRAMEWLHAQGLPVPLVDAASPPGSIVMEHVDGRTMFEELEEHPQHALRHARSLARLQRRVNSLVAPSWFPQKGTRTGRAVLHLDLHPMNVICGPDGPVIIDWSNFGRGSASLDAAMSFVLISTFEVARRYERVAQRAFATAFSLARGREVVRSGITEAAEMRLRDPHTTPGERVRAEEIIGRTRRR